MKRISKTLTLSFGLFSMASLVVPTAMGQTTQEKQQGSAEPAAQMTAQTVTINGKVSAVSDTSVTVVDGKKAEQTIAIDPSTKITKGGKAATAADIKADDAVVVVASKGEGDKLTAISIKIS
jgi:hypothetical protein